MNKHLINYIKTYLLSASALATKLTLSPVEPKTTDFNQVIQSKYKIYFKK